MNVRHSLLLTCALSASVLLSACGGDENLQLGSRDDIIIMKNGVPVGASTVPNAVTTSPSDMTVDTEAMVPAVENTPSQEMIADETSETVEEEVVVATSEIEQGTEDRAIEPVTEIEMVQTSATDQVEEAPEKVIESAQENAAETIEPVQMQQAKSVNTELMSAELAEDMAKNIVEQNATKPMATTPMKSADDHLSQVMETAPMKSAMSTNENAPEETVAVETTTNEETIALTKVEGGCYRNMLISKPQAIPVLEERRIVCEKDLTPSLVAIVQQALISREVKLGSADGKLGNQTMNAIETYQRENGLAVGGVTYELLDHLNIKI